MPGLYMPDLERAGCILFWGYNPAVARLSHATATQKALKGGARLVVVDPEASGGDPARLRLRGQVQVGGLDGRTIPCRPAFDLMARHRARCRPQRAQQITGVPAGEIRKAARILWEARPVAFYAWSGVEQHSNATQTVRAIGQLWALTGSFDVPGGNVRFPAVPTNPVEGTHP